VNRERADYGQNVMGEGTVRQRYEMFEAGLKGIHHEERCHWPSVVSDDLVQSVYRNT
jgi:hypothetical protein